MQRIRAYLVTVIILAIALHLAWDAIAPLVLPVVGVLIVLAVLGALYYRRLR